MKPIKILGENLSQLLKRQVQPNFNINCKVLVINMDNTYLDTSVTHVVLLSPRY